MGTKNNPGKFDCYANAEPDEPMFVLLGRDEHAPGLVERWVELRRAGGEDEAKLAEATNCARAMRKFRIKRKKADYGLLETADLLVSYKRGQMEGVSGDLADRWQQKLVNAYDNWTASPNGYDTSVRELIRQAINLEPVKVKDTNLGH